MIEIRVPSGDDFEAMVRADVRAFGDDWKPEDVDMHRAVMDLSRYRIAVDGSQIVGVAGSDAFEQTLPGCQPIAMAGVTWVSVAATHRRQGLLRRLMDAVHDDVAARDEPLAALTASEGGIYERFGYGVATQRRSISIDRPTAAFLDRFNPAQGAMRIVEGDAAIDAILERWERYRITRPGEVSRTSAWQRRLLHQIGPRGVCVVHDDGLAVWSIVDDDWNEGLPRHVLRVFDFAATTPEAHDALWATILGVDLVGTIVCRVVPPDDPLPWLLTNPRVVQTTAVNDGVWLRLMDIERCFAARRYAIDESVIVEAGDVEQARFKISGDPDGADVRTTRRRPDLVTDRAGLGSLLLGGVRVSDLVARRRATVRDERLLGRLDAFFVHHPTPHSVTAF